MTTKMDWELPAAERTARMHADFEDGSIDEAYRMAEEVFPPKADMTPPYTGGPAYYGWAIREAFLAGVRWERERAWISVKDRLPTTHYQFVLVAQEGGSVIMAQWNEARFNAAEDDGSWTYPLTCVTHWCPLPEPPR